ncbi:T9SS type A sorting domain-containing protein [bacterium]|nr:T9SS type A sorting domain-containing protein [bacterium]MBU1937654.1 T9SS type A sorting domain-containing protein [bacterium]
MKLTIRNLMSPRVGALTSRAIILLLILAPTCLAQLSGPLSGTLGPGEFQVVDTIYVNEVDSLSILPGTTFDFDGPYPFIIYGTLLAEGVEGDSIIFTTDTLANPDRWRGLRFLDSTSSGSRLSCCIIESGLSIGGWPEDPYGRGGAVYITGPSPTFNYCIFRNSGATYGGGVYCYAYSSPIFTNCIIENNWAARAGGGLYIRGSSGSFSDCIIRNNLSSVGGGIYNTQFSSTTYTNCKITNNSSFGGSHNGGGGGVFCWRDSPVFMNCVISGNSTNSRGGGASCAWWSTPAFTNCVFCDNTAESAGGGIYCYTNSSSILNNCAIVYNFATEWGGGVYSFSSSQTFTNCVFYGNSALGHGGGVSVEYLTEVRIENCILWENSPEQVYRSPDAELLRVYYCDVQDGGSSGINIDVDPRFRNPEEGDFHLMWTACGDSIDSPCIDRGNPDILDDSLDCVFGLGTSRSDIGIYGGNAVSTGVFSPKQQLSPEKFTLFQNYPNPFNATTTIRYDVKQASNVQLAIYNLLGQKVTTLTDRRHLPGSYSVSWKADDLPSGMYLCRMEVGDFVQTRKLVLLK